jgi:hypothetical protein
VLKRGLVLADRIFVLMLRCVEPSPQGKHAIVFGIWISISRGARVAAAL